MKHIKLFESFFKHNHNFKKGDIVVCIDTGNFLLIEVGDKFVVKKATSGSIILIKGLHNNFEDYVSKYAYVLEDDYEDWLIYKDAKKYNL